MKSFLAIVAACALANVTAYPTFVAVVPNGANVAGVAAIGHVNVEGGGSRNKFGNAFAKAGEKWTKELCEADSDGDGQTNGQELGDPCCVWTKGDVPQLSTASNPGDATNKADPTTWANMKCGGASASNATATVVSPEAVAPAATTTKPTSASSASATTMTTAAIVVVGLAALC